MKKLLVIIPCLNEAQNIGSLLEWLTNVDAHVAVVDGGSTDGTVDIAKRFEGPRVTILHNAKRLQSAAVNLAVKELGHDYEFLIRIDAHGQYPRDYCDILPHDAELTKADSVVVSMVTSGASGVQRATAEAQNSKLGTGGSSHRHLSFGKWVDHGHHALMRISAFRAVNGYDESFSHNEDAELDVRLRKMGFRIWLTSRTHMIYYPRSTFAGLFRQYMRYGQGRAKTVLKHRIRPRIRQLAPLAVLPAALLALASVAYWPAAVPLAIWIAICAGFGLFLLVRERDPILGLSGIAIMIMHFAWSLGFWRQLLLGESPP